jgi:hypothetical protein
MIRHGSKATWAILFLGSAVALAGCPVEEDERPPNAGATGTGGGAPTTCGNAVLDTGEDCDDGNNAPDDGCTACKVDECFKCTAEPGKLSVCSAGMPGQACQMTKVCNAMGACVECLDDSTCNGGYCFGGTCAKCDDTVKNGDETDADCGGTHCPTCAQGKTCQIGGDCTTTFCADGVCCDAACSDACQACNVASDPGSCTLIPKYEDDPKYGTNESCLGTNGVTCNGGGLCKTANGAPCMTNIDCASTKCSMNKTCVALAGEPCTSNADCSSNVCTNNVCE